MSLRGEMVPFLLRACPKLKSFGHGGSIPYGLELLSQYQDEEDDLILNLEELEIDFDYLDENDQKEVRYLNKNVIRMKKVFFKAC